ncbi:MAG: Chemotaxis protein PomA [Phycisphaerae bacterium]|nr:Chemotaxis protein PomA [Phycisphaerae bacterium]
MDLATLIGLLSGIALIAWAIVQGTNGQPGSFLDWQSVAIVFGGGIASALMSYPLKKVMEIAKVVKHAFMTKTTPPSQLIKDMVGYAEVARRDGILSLESLTKDIDDEFLIKGIQMAVDGSDPELIEQILESELEAVIARHEQGRGLFDALGKYAPAFGMIGTLVGLVIMLKNMDDPSKIGPGMATALLTTLYGALLANMFALPVSDKLRMRSDEEVLVKQIIIRGVMSIQSGDNPRIVEQKLKTYLSPAQRREMSDEQAEAA